VVEVVLIAAGVLVAISALGYFGDLGLGGLTGGGNTSTGPSPVTNPGGLNMDAVTFISKQETFSAYVYNDPPGSDKYSIGYGHQVRPGDPYFPNVQFKGPISFDEGKNLLLQDTLSSQSCVDSAVKVNLSQNQYTALVSLCYNIGCSAFSSSTLVRLLNQGNYQGASDQFASWVYSNGQLLSGLVNRRSQERSLFLA
jgi:lysozyme